MSLIMFHDLSEEVLRPISPIPSEGHADCCKFDVLEGTGEFLFRDNSIVQCL